jgi:hypothetical protein
MVNRLRWKPPEENLNQAETNNSYWLGMMSLAIEEGKTPDEFLDWERLLELTTVEKVQELWLSSILTLSE